MLTRANASAELAGDYSPRTVRILPSRAGKRKRFVSGFFCPVDLEAITFIERFAVPQRSLK